MGRLTNLKPALTTMRPSVAYMPQGEQERNKARATLPWRQWYNSKRWRDLRQQVLLRDGYQCQRTGVMCIGKSPAPNSPVVNHKRPHHGDPMLFWDIDNLETVTKAVHDGEVQREEKGRDP